MKCPYCAQDVEDRGAIYQHARSARAALHCPYCGEDDRLLDHSGYACCLACRRHWVAPWSVIPPPATPVGEGQLVGSWDRPLTPSDYHDHAFDRLYDTPDRPGLERGRDRQAARFDGDRVVER